MDKATATKYRFTVGDRVLMNLPDRAQRFTITGIITYGSADNLAGVTLAGFALPTAQALFHSRGSYDTINVLARPGVDNVRLQAAIARLLPPGVEVVSGQTVASQLSTAVDNALSFISTALLIFAAIALFVGGFTIFNTLSITVGQRTRELALLRLVGAGRRQVFGSVLGEAALTGLIASLVGLGLGVVAALGLKALLKAFGITLPAAPAGVSGAHADRRHRGRGRASPCSRRSFPPGALCGSHRWPRSSTTLPAPSRWAADASPRGSPWPSPAWRRPWPA